MRKTNERESDGVVNEGDGRGDVALGANGVTSEDFFCPVKTSHQHLAVMYIVFYTHMNTLSQGIVILSAEHWKNGLEIWKRGKV